MIAARRAERRRGAATGEAGAWVVALLLAASAPAGAGEPEAAALEPPPPCPAGKTREGEAQGQCCWPRQVWSDVQQVCVGVPKCPDGLVVLREACVEPPPPPILEAASRLPLPGTVPVKFVADQAGSTYVVRVGNAADETPCVLFLRPGPATVHVSGDADLAERIEVPRAPTVVRVARLRAGHLIAGGFVTAGGVAGLVAGALFLAQPDDPSHLGFLANAVHVTLGLTGIVTGLVCLAAGVAILATSGRNRLIVEPHLPMVFRSVRFAAGPGGLAVAF